jgi:hypothetical protein
MERRTPDHPTVAEFRPRLGKQIREVGKQVNHVALDMGFIALQEVATDETLVKASCPPQVEHATATRETLDKRLAQLEELWHSAQKRPEHKTTPTKRDDSCRKLYPKRVSDAQTATVRVHRPPVPCQRPVSKDESQPAARQSTQHCRNVREMKRQPPYSAETANSGRARGDSST